MKSLSGVITFVTGFTILAFCTYANAAKSYNIVVENYGITIFNVLFTLLFLIACCVAALLYGKGQNKNGLIGLISLFALPLMINIIFIPLKVLFDINIPYNALALPHSFVFRMRSYF